MRRTTPASAHGRLAGRAPVAALDQAAAAVGTTPDALALAAGLAQPWADVVLSGAVTAETLRSNLRALDVPWSAGLAQDLAALEEDSAEYWAQRASLAWN